MKNVIRLLSLAFFLQIGFVATAQDSPKKMLRKAKTAYSSYFMNPQANAESLEEARDLIEQAVADEELANDPAALIRKGEIYNAIAGKVASEASMGQVDMSDKNPGLIAYEAYRKALENSPKKFEERNIFKGLNENASHLSNMGNIYIGSGDYAGAYDVFNAVLELDALLIENDEKTVFPSESDFYNQKYVVAVCAAQIGKTEEAKEQLHDLYQASYEEPQVYSILFNILNAEGNDDEAVKVMNRGKDLFPDNTAILFAEINYLIQNEEYQELESKLQQAIAKDPENPSVRAALGNVYMNLQQSAFEEGEEELEKEYFDKAIDYFNQAIEIDNASFDAYYSIGMMYFNKAAAFTQEMQGLGLREQERYDELDKLVKDYFEEALPYFKKAESLNPNDRNTLMGLREILARMNKLDQSEDIKTRLDALQEGETYSEPYFDNE